MKLSWSSPLTHLNRNQKATKTTDALEKAGIQSIMDLLWVLPLKIQKAPTITNFYDIDQEGETYRGRGKVLNVSAVGGGRSFRSKIPRLNFKVILQDHHSAETLHLYWFNSYPSVYQKMQKLNDLEFLGQLKYFRSIKQIINPQVFELSESNNNLSNEKDYLIDYPTINKTSGKQISKLLEKIPVYLWQQLHDTLPANILKKRNLISLPSAFKTIHGKSPQTHWSREFYQKAINRLVYEEFFDEQLKLKLRRSKYKAIKAIKFKSPSPLQKQLHQKLPFQLTSDQKSVLDDIASDLRSGRPMMRLLQGDVGCGKTLIAFSATLDIIQSKRQVALMCPTESLALQHYQSARNYFSDFNIQVDILLGSHKAKQKREKLEALVEGRTQLVIGTHSLIQKNVSFKNLNLVIIDEQHKFGVEQRIKLTSKGNSVHCLIMTATPIPRSLSLTQYGDLDISTIKTMPTGRAGIRSKIVWPNQFDKFLNFLNTRLSLNEQAYIVVPAIEENENLDLMALKQVYEKFIKFFPQRRISYLHGRMPPQEKEEAFLKFSQHEIDLLISTSVVEVGINVTNATVMAILNPERFGLSSLHQLRGRVGRGAKPGFFFMLLGQSKNADSSTRLKVVEQTNDGFKIAEEDLKIRGRGDLFGAAQSGYTTSKKIANIVTHSEQLQWAKQDIEELSQAQPEFLKQKLKQYTTDPMVLSTI